MSWLAKLMNKPLEENPLDKAIVDKLPAEGEVEKIYQARWVWYHTILAIEIGFTNILLLMIFLVLAFK